jgi:DNA-binding FrmR family transcriptional regulator
VGHTYANKQKLLHRVRRIRGQLDAVERALGEDEECSTVLQTLAACRGALSSLLAEIVEGHVQHHLFAPGKRRTAGERAAAEELVQLVRAWFR